MKITIDPSHYTIKEINEILEDLDHLWEADTNQATLKLIEPIYNTLMEYKTTKQEEINTTFKNIEESEKRLDKEVRIELGKKECEHFLKSRRLQWTSDIDENCQCALWSLWSTSYKFCEPEEIPVSSEELQAKLEEFANMTQEERNEARLQIVDGLYCEEGVDIPCPICGFQVEEEE